MKQTRDFLIRNMPVEVYLLLEQTAKENHRSKTQEAIVALIKGLTGEKYRVRQPKPFKWKTKLTPTFIKEAIDEGRE